RKPSAFSIPVPTWSALPPVGGAGGTTCGGTLHCRIPDHDVQQPKRITVDICDGAPHKSQAALVRFDEYSFEVHRPVFESVSILKSKMNPTVWQTKPQRSVRSHSSDADFLATRRLPDPLVFRHTLEETPIEIMGQQWE